MPIFDFKCSGCGKVSEIIVRRANEEVTCPECGSADMKKLMTSSYSVRQSDGPSRNSTGGSTCCGRSERCQKPPCSDEGRCTR